jgi:integrase
MMSEGAAKPRLGPEHLKALNRALDRSRKADPASLLSLIREWRSENPDRLSSPEWEALAASTKKTWGGQLVLIEAKWGETPLAIWSDPRMVAKVVAWRDSRRDTPRAADIGITVLRALLEFGRLRGRVTINVAERIPTLYRSGGRAEIIWTDVDIERFTAAATKLGRPQLVDGLRLAALTGLRREDLVTLTWDQVGEFAITKKALKRSRGKRRRMTMPRIPALDALLQELRGRTRILGVETVLVNSYGRPWTGDGFGGSFNLVRDEAAILHVDEETGERRKKHLHDVRGTFCTKLLTESDLTDREAAEIMGWSPERVADIRRVYVDQARVVVAIGERIRHIAVKRSVKRPPEDRLSD